MACILETFLQAPQNYWSLIKIANNLKREKTIVPEKDSLVQQKTFLKDTSGKQK
jgi:hypothetical protein